MIFFFFFQTNFKMLGKHWAMNMSGCTLKQKHMADIPHPRSELHVHVACKTVQMGSLIGTFAIGPLLAGIKGDRNVEGIKSWMEKCGRNGVFLGLLAGPVLTEYQLKATNSNALSIYDRCFRLRYNRCQVRVDRLSLVGAAAGFVTASYLGDSGALGALVGLNTGLILASLMNACYIWVSIGSLNCDAF